jgi:hypothetical protein
MPSASESPKTAMVRGVPARAFAVNRGTRQAASHSGGAERIIYTEHSCSKEKEPLTRFAQ